MKEVNEENINELCRAILEGAKAPFRSPASDELPVSAISSRNARIPAHDSDAESDISSAVSHTSSSRAAHGTARTGHGGRKRGRPKKLDVDSGRCGTPIMMSHGQVSASEAYKVG